MFWFAPEGGKAKTASPACRKIPSGILSEGEGPPSPREFKTPLMRGFYIYNNKSVNCGTGHPPVLLPRRNLLLRRGWPWRIRPSLWRAIRAEHFVFPGKDVLLQRDLQQKIIRQVIGGTARRRRRNRTHIQGYFRFQHIPVVFLPFGQRFGDKVRKINAFFVFYRHQFFRQCRVKNAFPLAIDVNSKFFPQFTNRRRPRRRFRRRKNLSRQSRKNFRPKKGPS